MPLCLHISPIPSAVVCFSALPPPCVLAFHTRSRMCRQVSLQCQARFSCTKSYQGVCVCFNLLFLCPLHSSRGISLSVFSHSSLSSTRCCYTFSVWLTRSSPALMLCSPPPPPRPLLLLSFQALDRMQLLEGVEDEATFRFEFPDPDRLEATVSRGSRRVRSVERD